MKKTHFRNCRRRRQFVKGEIGELGGQEDT